MHRPRRAKTMPKRKKFQKTLPHKDLRFGMIIAGDILA